MKKKILIIIADIECNRPRAIRFKNLILQLKNEYDVTVITFNNASNRVLSELGIAKVIIDYSTIGKKIFDQVNSLNGGVNQPPKPKRNRKFISRLKKYLLFPDNYIIEFFTLKKALLKILKTNYYDYIISVSYPYTNLLFAKIIKKNITDETKLVIDIGDPFSTNSGVYYNKIYKYFKKIIERVALEQADSIVVTTESTKNYFLAKYPFTNNKISIIEQGVNLRITSPNTDVMKKKVDKIIFIYAGIFYKKLRDPTNLFRAMHAIQDPRVQLKIFGPYDKYFYQSDLIDNKRICYKGSINNEALFSEYNKADVLVFIDNNNTIQLPGKIFEYISAKKPILFIHHGISSPALKLIKNYKAVKLALNRTEDITAAINSICNNLHTYDFEFDLSPYTWEARAKKYSNLLKSF